MTEGMRHDRRWRPFKTRLAAAIADAGDITMVVIDEVADALQETLKVSGRTGAALFDAAAEVGGSAIHGAMEIGCELGAVAQGVLVGVLRGTRVTGETAMRTISHTAGSAIHQTAELGGDLGGMAKGLVHGAVRGAAELGLDATQAATAAAQGAFDAAYEIGSAAAEKVRKALAGTIGGVKIVLKEPFRMGGRR